jgi:alpha-glucosidase
MLEYLRLAQTKGIKVSGLWIQDWAGKLVTPFGSRLFWNWRWNETWYPGNDT